MTDTEQLERLANRLRLLSERGLNTFDNCLEEASKYTPSHIGVVEQCLAAVEILKASGYEWEYMSMLVSDMTKEEVTSTLLLDGISGEFKRQLQRKLRYFPVEMNDVPKFFDTSPITEQDIPY